MHPALRSTDHRPWPLPSQPWIWQQSWLDLAFIHFPVAAEKLAPLLPAGIHLDHFGGTAWIGLVPFRMAAVRRRTLPHVSLFGTFPELNVRTYVNVGGKPGVWFFSLDAASWPIVIGGRIYNLPYYRARMRMIRRDGWIDYTSSRFRSDTFFRGRYRPTGDVFFAQTGTFEHWATERYCLYAHSARRGLARMEVHHAPWPLQRANAEIDKCNLLEAAGISAPLAPPVCHFSAGVSVVSFPGIAV